MTDRREQWTQELNARIGRSRRPAPLRNVVERVAAVLHGSELAFVDNALHEEDGVSGRIAVFTDTIVAVIDVAGVAPSFAHAPRSDQGTTTVPHGGRLALHYDGMDTPLVLPSDDADSFAALVPGLVGDLGR